MPGDGERAERRFLAMRRIQRANWSVGAPIGCDIPAVAWFALAIRLRAALGDDGSWREATAIGWVVAHRAGLPVPITLARLIVRERAPEAATVYVIFAARRSGQ